MNKFFLFVLAVIVIVVGGKFGLEHYYSKKLDEAINVASFVADIKYENVKIGFDGSISINNLIIEPHSPDTLVRMDAITLFSSDILLPVNLATFIKRAEIPEELGVRIANMEYDPSVFEAKVNQNNKCRHIETTINANNAGVSRLNANVEVSFETNTNNTVVNFRSSDQTAEMKSRTLLDANIFKLNQSASNSQPIKEMKFEYKLNELTAAEIIRNCAEHLAISTDDYVNNVIATPLFLQTTGADFGNEANLAVAEFMQGGKWMNLNSKPSSQLKSFDNLSLYKAKDIVRLLGLELTVDTKEVKLNMTELVVSDEPKSESDSLSPYQEQRAARQALIDESYDARLSDEEKQRIKLMLEDNEASKIEKYSYQTTSLGNLNRYINYSVIFKRSGDKKQITGELVRIEEGIYIVETNKYGGKTELSVSPKDVVEAMVYR